MTVETPAPDRVAITAKRLDSDEVTETSATVEIPAPEAAQREQLGDLVRAQYPGAEFRSFAGGAATFLAPKLLIVAVYIPSGENAAAAAEDGNEDQQQLFAA